MINCCASIILEPQHQQYTKSIYSRNKEMKTKIDIIRGSISIFLSIIRKLEFRRKTHIKRVNHLLIMHPGNGWILTFNGLETYMTPNRGTEREDSFIKLLLDCFSSGRIDIEASKVNELKMLHSTHESQEIIFQLLRKRTLSFVLNKGNAFKFWTTLFQVFQQNEDSG